jgi:hypothetical protein
MRAENVKAIDFIISRGSPICQICEGWIKTKIKKTNNTVKTEFYIFKGGDLTEELKDFPKQPNIGYPIF